MPESKGGCVCVGREGREEGERQMKLVKEPGFIHWTITVTGGHCAFKRS